MPLRRGVALDALTTSLLNLLKRLTNVSLRLIKPGVTEALRSGLQINRGQEERTDILPI